MCGVFCCLFLGNVFAQNIVKNGDFEKGKKNWKGKSKVVSLNEENVLAIELKNKKKIDAAATQRLNTKGKKGVEFSFRMHCSEDYVGEGLEVHVGHHQLKGIRFSIDAKAAKKKGWHVCNGKIEDLDRKNPDIYFTPQKGEGKLYIDDIVVKELLEN